MEAKTSVLGIILEEDFVKPIKDICSICSSIFVEPCLTPCGHHFCRECISEVLQRRPECPLDRHNLTGYTPFRDMALERKILQKTVRCPNRRTKKSEECTWVGPLSSIVEHLNKSCPLEEVNCTIGCGEIMQRKMIAKHLILCPKREIECEYCSTKFLQNYKEIHLQNCVLFPVSCPFKSNGCLVSLPKIKMEDHIHSSLPTHLELVLQENNKLKKDRKDTIQDYFDLRKKIKYWKIQDFELNSKITFGFNVGDYTFTLNLLHSNTLNIVLIANQRVQNRILTWPIWLTFKVFAKNKLTSRILESKELVAEFLSPKGTFSDNAFSLTDDNSDPQVMKRWNKLGIYIISIKDSQSPVISSGAKVNDLLNGVGEKDFRLPFTFDGSEFYRNPPNSPTRRYVRVKHVPSSITSPSPMTSASISSGLMIPPTMNYQTQSSTYFPIYESQSLYNTSSTNDLYPLYTTPYQGEGVGSRSCIDFGQNTQYSFL